ncbi:MAG TPA: asparagine synthetase B, partial [Acidimicrobiia bacterium]|nr:asparagine synthetase B [Acidimicrobiia bacterium]
MYTAPDGMLGHRRLSIVDVGGGHQPIVDVTGRRAIVANGEIYNAAELRSVLDATHEFASRSDSEVALHLHTDQGAAAAKQLDGMFAIAVAEDERVLLMRDPVGIKPLYIGSYDDGTV